MLRDTFVCGMADSGILSERQAGEAQDAVVRGTASVLNGGSGVEVRRSVAIDLGNDGGADAGDNGFAGNPANRQVFNNMSPTATVLAQGNQWQSCYPAGSDTAEGCDVDAIAADDTNDVPRLVQPRRRAQSGAAAGRGHGDAHRRVADARSPRRPHRTSPAAASTPCRASRA